MNPKSGVSAHYLVPKEPVEGQREVFGLVLEEKKSLARWCQLVVG
ncbi:hypothetical protein [Candidatus Coxiella mudrowiae]|nr:hypothetical protein [Candidatus Coxiella mudrowiae]